ncbi:MAG TPA: ribosomal-processing cysteine protease Prp [Firmicutes bacterium]|nr:ribosomal-processing cysteine protease Prp [Bacillota bacterium]
MTEIEFFAGQNQQLRGFRIKNHTGYADKGEDIVCAAVSALGQTAVLGLRKVVGLECSLTLKEAYLSCILPDDLPDEKQAAAQLILKVLYEGLNAIEEEYGRYVRVKGVRYNEN